MTEAPTTEDSATEGLASEAPPTEGQADATDGTVDAASIVERVGAPYRVVESPAVERQAQKMVRGVVAEFIDDHAVRAVYRGGVLAGVVFAFVLPEDLKPSARKGFFKLLQESAPEGKNIDVAGKSVYDHRTTPTTLTWSTEEYVVTVTGEQRQELIEIMSQVIEGA